MAKPKLILYVDIVSPFAYLAFHILHVSWVLLLSKDNEIHASLSLCILHASEVDSLTFLLKWFLIIQWRLSMPFSSRCERDHHDDLDLLLYIKRILIVTFQTDISCL